MPDNLIKRKPKSFALFLFLNIPAGGTRSYHWMRAAREYFSEKEISADPYFNQPWPRGAVQQRRPKRCRIIGD